MPGPLALEQSARDRSHPDLERPVPTRYRYGVDLYNPTNLSAPLAGKSTGKLDYVIDQEGREPVFVGRYIKNPSPAAEAKPEEIDFIRGRGIRFLPIYCPTRGHAETKGEQGREWGRAAAKNAVTLAGTLHIPGDVYVYANIEPGWALTSDWVVGWCEGYGSSAREGYGGLYCGPVHLRSQGPVAAAMDALESSSVRMFMAHHVTRPALWVSFPSTGERRTPTALPTLSPEIGEVDVWQYAIGVVGAGLAANSWGYDRDVANDYALDHMWGSD